MKIVIAPDKFKGSLNSFQVCNAVENGLLNASTSFEIVKRPMADGGDGLSEVVVYYTDARWRTSQVQNPLGKIISAQWLLSSDGKTAFIEMAKASGLQLLKPEEYNPLLTSTYGTGQLIVAAIDRGVQNIIIGIGGSATNDGGIGMAAAMGYHFLDDRGNELLPIGKNLIHINKIDLRNRQKLKNINFRIACDVKNLLYGEQGATKIYAPQKGANEEMIGKLERGIVHFASIVKKDLGIDVSDIEGGGAAGGMGAGCVAFLDATLVSGIELVMQLASLEEHIKNADVVITGEGKIDEQSLQGKVVSGVASLAKRHNKKLIAVCGSLLIEPYQLNTIGIDAAFSILKPPMSLDEAIKNAEKLLQNLAYNIGCSINE
jgi:glycerate 2-kinase